MAQVIQAFTIGLMVTFIYAVIGVEYFGDDAKESFGTFSRAVYTVCAHAQPGASSPPSWEWVQMMVAQDRCISESADQAGCRSANSRCRKRIRVPAIPRSEIECWVQLFAVVAFQRWIDTAGELESFDDDGIRYGPVVYIYSFVSIPATTCMSHTTNCISHAAPPGLSSVWSPFSGPVSTLSRERMARVLVRTCLSADVLSWIAGDGCGVGAAASCCRSFVGEFLLRSVNRSCARDTDRL